MNRLCLTGRVASLGMTLGRMALVFLPVAALAADGVTLERWMAAALERDPDIAEARADVSWERGRADAMEIWEDPEVRIGRERREDREYRSSFRLRVPIPNPWEVQAARREGEARADVEYLRMEAVAWERSMALATMYFQAAHAQELFALRNTFVDGFTQDFQNAENGYKARAITRARLVDMRAELALAKVQLAGDSVDWVAQRERLRARAGWTDVAMTALSTPLPGPTDLTRIPEMEELHKLAFRERGELGALASERRRDIARQAVSRSQGVPWITFLEGTWVREKASGREDFEARVAVTLPIFTWMRRSQTEEALRLVRSSDRMAAYVSALESALQSAWHTATAQAERMQTVFATTKDSLAEIEEALDTPILDPRQRSGLRERWMDLKKERLDASLDYQLALIDLMSVTGPGFPFRGVTLPQATAP